MNTKKIFTARTNKAELIKKVLIVTKGSIEEFY